MRKFLLSLAALMAVSNSTNAGGYLTNTNQSAAFLRNPARDAAIAIDGAYSNPAGIGFMSNGWHFEFNIQSAYQTRTATSTFGTDLKPFALGLGNDPSGVKEFRGKAKAPVVPSLDLALVRDKWFFSLAFAITGGGGKCTFDEGLGSFESQVAMVPVMINTLSPGAVTGYTADSYMRGRQYYFGGQLGIGYKITPQLNVSVGGRLVYADCNYYGYVRNISVNAQTPAGPQLMPAGQFFAGAGMPHFAALTADRELNCDQTGWGFTPIVSVDYKLGRLNLAAKYEFKTRLRLKNRSGLNTSGLEEYDDGKRLAADIPAIVTLGAQYEFLPQLRGAVGFHYYFDKQATQHGGREKHLKGGGWEVLAGVEYDINKHLTVSAGGQSTNYGLGKDSRFISDMSFVSNSFSFGLGAKIRLRDNIHLNVAYFKTLYKHYTKNMEDYDGLKATMTGMMGQLVAAGQANPEMQLTPGELQAVQQIGGAMQHFSTAGSDRFHRTNDVFGVGIDIDF